MAHGLAVAADSGHLIALDVCRAHGVPRGFGIHVCEMIGGKRAAFQFVCAGTVQREQLAAQFQRIGNAGKCKDDWLDAGKIGDHGIGAIE
jgi:hypothetical protein